MASDQVRDIETLRRHYVDPTDIVRAKERDRLDDFCRDFIALSPLVCVASASADGGSDCSPRGDAPGFVAVIDDRTLLIPDRRGNNRLDSMHNILTRPEVGLLFLVPGIDETLRVNGACRIVSDQRRLAPLGVRGKTPPSALEVTVREVFFHCGKALKRARLWQPERHVARASFPSLGRIIAEQTRMKTVEEVEDLITESYEKKLY